MTTDAATLCDWFTFGAGAGAGAGVGAGATFVFEAAADFTGAAGLAAGAERDTTFAGALAAERVAAPAFVATLATVFATVFETGLAFCVDFPLILERERLWVAPFLDLAVPTLVRLLTLGLLATADFLLETIFVFLTGILISRNLSLGNGRSGCDAYRKLSLPQLTGCHN